jgi:competence protein ComFC
MNAASAASRRLTLPRAWASLAETVLGFFYPENCQICRTAPATPGEGYVCSRCRQQVRFIRPPFCRRCGLPYSGEITSEFQCANCRELEFQFSSARSAVVARTVVLEAIHRYKYRRHLWFEPFLGDLLVREAVPVLGSGQWDLIVPVPLHPVKEREREFNQAARLGWRLSQASQIPFDGGLLQRLLPTRSQTRLSREERAANMRHAFAARAGGKLEKKRTVLVDDVFTTGATTNACALALRRAGAAEVCVWTVARGL